MKIQLAPVVTHKLLACAAATRLEFSGFGFCERRDGDIYVYDFVLMDVGNEVYTEIDPAKILPLMEREDRANMKVWLHRHPVNSWSSRDIQTILKEPLGSTPEAVGWSVSIVLTPIGWVARIDNYKNGITKELEVEPSVSDIYKEIRELEQARFPFRGGARAGNGSPILEADVREDCDEEELDGWEEYEDEYEPDYSHYSEDEQLLLVQLALFRTDPASTSLAEVLEEYGIDWQEIRQAKGQR